MAVKITEEILEYVQNLAKLELSQEEKRKIGLGMEEILTYVEILNSVSTEGIEPMSHVFSLENVFREDVVTNGDDRKALLKNAPAKDEGCFVVNKTVV